MAAACTKYYWPTMHLDIEQNTARCLSCAQTKGTTKTAPILEYPLHARLYDIVAIDPLQLPCSHQGSTYVLVCNDHFSQFVILAPLPTKSAPVVAHAIVSHLICPFTAPHVLLSDNRIEFKNAVLASVCEQYNIKQTITAHHPTSVSSKRAVERFLAFFILQGRSQILGKIGSHIWLPPSTVLSTLL